MKRILLAALAACGLLAPTASAQVPQIGSYQRPYVSPRPTVSPYLNLNRAGTDPAINYYGIVRPQLEMQQDLRHMQQELQPGAGMAVGGALPPGVGGVTGTELVPTTGHPVAFFNTAQYFPMNYAFGGTTGAGGAGGAGGGFAGGRGVGNAGLGQGFGPAVQGSRTPFFSSSTGVFFNRR